MSKTLPYETTLEVRDACLCLHSQRAARALARRFDKAFQHLELTNGQFSLLMSLNRPQAAPMGPIAHLLAMDRTTLTAMLKPLERRGLVTISISSNDRRNRLLALTDAGRALMAAATPIWRETHAEIEAQLPGLDPDGVRLALNSLAA